jgi:hypothetical protein
LSCFWPGKARFHAIVFPWQVLAYGAAEGFDDGAIKVLALDPDALGAVIADEGAEVVDGVLERHVSDLGGEGFVVAMEGDGFRADVAADGELAEEIGVEKEAGGFHEVRAVEGDGSDLGDKGIRAAGEGLDVEDDGMGEHGIW